MADKMTEEDPNFYVVCDYSATGEGRTIMILITRANPQRNEKHNDYEIEPSFDENWQYIPGIEKTTPEERALREFAEEFDSYFAIGAEVLDRVEFFHRFRNHVPDYLYKMTDPQSNDRPGGFHYKSQLHFNFS